MDIGEETLQAVIPQDPSQTARDWFYLRKLPSILDDATSPIRLLDLGSGEGQSFRIANEVLGTERLHWTGVDIGDSTEHLTRSESAPPVDVYDGVKLPYADCSFDVVWCKQVLEHVRHPDAVIAEVARVLRPGGFFIGSVSQLEPYHSRSIFNWTHYGIRTVLGDHGLKVTELTPGVDGLLLMLRSVFGYHTGLNKFFARDTPFNLLLQALFERDNLPAPQRHHAAFRQRLKIAGHIHFLSRKAA